MAANSAPLYEMVAAIDFGTTYSGYAYSYQHDKDKVYVNSNWSSGSSMWKVPTAILFDDQQNFLAFGEKAENMYNEYAECEEEHKYYYFSRFKMNLYKKKHSKRDLTLNAANGKPMKAMDIFSGAIHYLKEHLIESVNGRNQGNTVTVNNIKWVLTVPAIWDDSAKQFMREAAEKAGIPKKTLLIALEPECASLYCKSLPDKKRLGINMDNTGVKYMVLDNGGGTIDVTVHEKTARGDIKEIYKATGGAWGGTKVDQLFEEYLVSILSLPVVTEVKKKHPADWMDMMRDFEKIKRSINKNQDNETCSFLLKPAVCDVYKELIEIDLEKAFKNNLCAKGTTMRGRSRLQIPTPVITDMMGKVSTDVGKHVTTLFQLKEVRNIDFIIMVGGFSNLHILVDKVKDIAGNIPVMVPEEAELAVLRGAVLVGWNSNFIKTRRSRRTYGKSAYLNFDPALDPERLKYINEEGTAKCKKRFDRMVTVNQEVNLKHRISKRSTPLFHDQTQMLIAIYACDREDVRFCDELGVELVGEIIIPIPNPHNKSRSDREVVTRVMFGLTEITVEAHYAISGESVSAVFNCL